MTMMSAENQSTTVEPLSPRQLASLKGIINGLLPPLDPPNEKENEDYWTFDLSRDPDFIDALTLAIQLKLNDFERLQMKLLLTTLSTTLGSALLFQIPTTTSFIEWNAEHQSRALQKLQHSPITLKRMAFSSLKRLICGLAYSFIQKDSRTNPFWNAMNYPGPPSIEPGDVQPDFDSDQAFVTVSNDAMTLEYDVVIVGSGAGGGVAAAILSQSGYSVLVLEKGAYVPPNKVTGLECEALDQMYEKHSLLTTNDGNVMILAGSTLGGGTTVNWACCLPLPDSVRNEWITEHGLTQFGNDEYTTSLKQVSERIGCINTSKVIHNTMNQKMKKGCKVMGYSCETTGQNFRDTTKENAGYTCFGDAERNKQGGLVTYLSDAVKNSAKIIDNASVQRIIYETTDGRKRAVGVEAIVNHGHLLHVKAQKCVIVAAGSLHSPCLLQRSGFKNPHIGRHLHLHPVTAVSGFFAEQIHSHLGAPMTTVCNHFPNAKLECPCAHTGLMAAACPFFSAGDFKDKMLRISHGMSVIVLRRDVATEGRVRVASDGFSPSIDYTLKEGDRQSMMNALKGVVKILAASGANEICTAHIRDTELLLNDDEKMETADDIKSSDKIQTYLLSIDKRGMREHEIGVFSAHQMGTCRMSASPDSGVVDENAECWECDNLYVMDASIFPTASGANPMLTTLTLSHMMSTRLAMLLKFEDNQKAVKIDSTEAKERFERRMKSRIHQPSYNFTLSIMRPWAVLAIAVASVGIARSWRE
jgi:choline dehydrogenase-like flavoprotein